MFALVARDDLRFGFDFELAQLLAQTEHRLIEFLQIEAVSAHLLLETRAVDRHFASVIDEVVEQIGADTDHFLRDAAGLFGFLDQFAGRTGRRCGRCRNRRRRFERRHSCRRLRRLGGVRHWHRSRLGRRVSDGRNRFARHQCVEARDGIDRHADRLTSGHTLHQLMQSIETAFQRLQRNTVHAALTFRHLLQQGFHGVAEIADRRQSGHARAALQGVQLALQSADDFALMRLFAQTRHHRVGGIENVAAFLHEDFQQIFVHVRQVQ